MKHSKRKTNKTYRTNVALLAIFLTSTSCGSPDWDDSTQATRANSLDKGPSLAQQRSLEPDTTNTDSLANPVCNKVNEPDWDAYNDYADKEIDAFVRKNNINLKKFAVLRASTNGHLVPSDSFTVIPGESLKIKVLDESHVEIEFLPGDDGSMFVHGRYQTCNNVTYDGGNRPGRWHKDNSSLGWTWYDK